MLSFWKMTWLVSRSRWLSTSLFLSWICMVVSPDFLQFMEHTSPLLDMDPTVWCISSWNDLGDHNLAKDLQRLFRTDFFPGLGWMLKREVRPEPIARHSALSCWRQFFCRHGWNCLLYSRPMYGIGGCVSMMLLKDALVYAPRYFICACNARRLQWPLTGPTKLEFWRRRLPFGEFGNIYIIVLS